MAIIGGSGGDDDSQAMQDPRVTAVDEVRDPAAALRVAAGGSETGTSTGSAIISQSDPLAGAISADPHATAENPTGAEPSAVGESVGRFMSRLNSLGERLSGVSGVAAVVAVVFTAYRLFGGD